MRETDLSDFVATEQVSCREVLKSLSVFGWLQGAGAQRAQILSLCFLHLYVFVQ